MDRWTQEVINQLVDQFATTAGGFDLFPGGGGESGSPNGEFYL